MLSFASELLKQHHRKPQAFSMRVQTVGDGIAVTRDRAEQHHQITDAYDLDEGTDSRRRDCRQSKQMGETT